MAKHQGKVKFCNELNEQKKQKALIDGNKN